MELLYNKSRVWIMDFNQLLVLKILQFALYNICLTTYKIKICATI